MTEGARERYEAAVRALALKANRLRAGGASEEAIARDLVQRRNDLKRVFRKQDPPAIVRLMEARNLARYGDPVGPGADQLLSRYGGWTLVVDAACRPGNLSRR